MSSTAAAASAPHACSTLTLHLLLPLLLSTLHILQKVAKEVDDSITHLSFNAILDDLEVLPRSSPEICDDNTSAKASNASVQPDILRL